jgi:hypothetical protein
MILCNNTNKENNMNNLCTCFCINNLHILHYVSKDNAHKEVTHCIKIISAVMFPPDCHAKLRKEMTE